MMFSCYIFFLSAFQSPTQVPSIHHIRRLFEQAAYDKAACHRLADELDKVNITQHPVMSGYKACTYMLKAKYGINPFSKLSHFSKGKALLEECILQHPDSLELRFLRFAIQCNSPSFLGYQKSKSEDLAFILSRLPGNTDEALKKMIIRYMLDSSEVCKADKNKLALNR